MSELPNKLWIYDRLNMNNFWMQVASTVISTCVMTDIIQRGMYLPQLYQNSGLPLQHICVSSQQRRNICELQGTH